MSIIGLDRIITGNLLSRISKASSNSGASSTSALSANTKELKGQALYDSLRMGARNFSAGLELLNSAISFVNISLDTHEKLLEIVDKVDALVTKANKGNMGPSAARSYNRDFDTLAKDFEYLIEKVSGESKNILSPDDLAAVLDQAGLDKEKVGELAAAFKKISPIGEAVIDSSGNIVSEGNPIPLESFHKALRAAVVDPDDPESEDSGTFTKVRSSLKALRGRLEGNVKALKQTVGIVADNMALVRAAGLAFLDLSNSITGSESAERVADEIRGKIRAAAPASLGQAHNIEAILAAGLAAIDDTKKTKTSGGS